MSADVDHRPDSHGAKIFTGVFITKLNTAFCNIPFNLNYKIALQRKMSQTNEIGMNVLRLDKSSLTQKSFANIDCTCTKTGGEKI